MQNRQKIKQFIVIVLSIGFLFPLAGASAATTKSSTASSSSTSSSGTNITQAVTQSYTAVTGTELGMIVQLKPSDQATVEPLSATGDTSMLGVIVAANDATVTLTPQTAAGAQQVYVATSGRYNVLISNQNGPINVGDYITISSVSGIGMKADTNQAVVLGKAVGSFNGTSNVSGTIKLTDANGKTNQVAIGQIAVDLDVAHNPLESKNTDYVPSFLSKAATTVSGGKPVSAARIYLGIITLMVSAVITGNLLYSGVRSGMLAIGRNPLSRKSIIRSLVQTVIAGLIIFIVGIFAVYLLLKL